MNRFIFSLLLLGNSFYAFSQSIENAKNALDRQRYHKSLTELHDMIRLNPETPEAWVLLSQAYIEIENAETAIDTLQNIPASIISHPLILCANAQLDMATGLDQDAGKLFDQALKKTKSKNPEVLYQVAIGQLMSNKGNTDYAIELLEKAIKRDSQNSKYFLALGDAYRKKQEGGAAYRAYLSALEINAQNPLALYKCGKLFVAQRNPDMYVAYFEKAGKIDSLFAPAWFELYSHYYFLDPSLAMKYLEKYIATSGPDKNNEYLITDLLYLSKDYGKAINHALALINSRGKEVKPRIYKLAALSYKECSKPTNDAIKYAAGYMQEYFQQQPDSNETVRDYELMSEIYRQIRGMEDSAAHYLAFASNTVDSTKKPSYYYKIAELLGKGHKYAEEAKWRKKYYMQKKGSTNLDLFNWGIACFKAKKWELADSVFKIYEAKYPDDKYGYYWTARSSAAIDTTMGQALAIPHYQKVVELASSDTANPLNKKYLIEAYGYLAAYEANINKDYESSVENFEKLLELDPGNKEALRYVDILKKNLEETQSSQ